jgi:hypothetical protein
MATRAFGALVGEELITVAVCGVIVFVSNHLVDELERCLRHLPIAVQSEDGAECGYDASGEDLAADRESGRQENHL